MGDSPKEINMSYFTILLRNTIVSSSDSQVTISNEFQNIAGVKLLEYFKRPLVGHKDGSHFLRTSLSIDDKNRCLPRSNSNATSQASLLVLDCDKRIDINGEVLEGAPDPKKISAVLIKNNIGFILYGSYSHYVGSKGHRYRIIMLTKSPYTQSHLAAIVEKIISQINANLDSEMLANVSENCVWSQPWYYPRKPKESIVDDLYFDNLEGEGVEVVEPYVLPPMVMEKIKVTKATLGSEEESPIVLFNTQHSIENLLSQYGYKKVYSSNEYQKWLSPSSKSGSPGIAVKDNKFFSHHGDEFNDGYWHDAFDLMRVSEGLSKKEAVRKITQNIFIFSECIAGESSRSLACFAERKEHGVPQSILHSEILKELSKKIMPIDFREASKIDGDERLKTRHFHIIVIQEILALAKANNWGVCRNHDFIYVYNGEYWSLVNIDDLKIFLGESAEKMGVCEYDARHFHFREQLFKQFMAQAHLTKPEQQKDVVCINLKNGTFKITPISTDLKLFSRDDFITYQLPFEFNNEAKSLLFEEYLNKVLPNRELQNILAEYLGYVFIQPSTLKLEKTLLLYGKGANGKSVFYEIVRNLFGEHNTAEYSLQSLTDSSGYYRAMLTNKLVNYASEISGRLVASIFKQLVSGEPVEARLPYGRPFMLTHYAKLIFNCNDLPKDVEQSEAYFRRFLIIPFDVTIPENEQDKQLAKKIIESELSGIFNWVLAGLRRLLENKKFTDSDAVRAVREQYEKESDSVKLFVDEEGYAPNSNCSLTIISLYSEYRTFCHNCGFQPVNKINFTKRLENCRIVIERKNIGMVAFVLKKSSRETVSKEDVGDESDDSDSSKTNYFYASRGE